jgi:hypothetical protein
MTRSKLLEVRNFHRIGAALQQGDRVAQPCENFFKGCCKVVVIVNDQNSSLHKQAGRQKSTTIVI